MTRHPSGRHIAGKDRARNRVQHGVDTANAGVAQELSTRSAELYPGPRRPLRPAPNGYDLTPDELLRWRDGLRVGDTVLWYPHGMVRLEARAADGWTVSGSGLVGQYVAREAELRPVPGFRYDVEAAS